MIGLVGLWGFLGLLGIREILLIALVTLALYGRSGLPQNRYVRLLRPWVSPARRPVPGRPPRPPARPRVGVNWDRVYWFLMVVAATAVAAWIATRMFIVSAPGVVR